MLRISQDLYQRFRQWRCMQSELGRVGHRHRLAQRYLAGQGIEIGGLNAPLPVRPGVKVTYVDRCSTTQLRQTYPELSGSPLVDVDVIDDGERLDKFASESQDFVIANHFLEHTQDPIRTLKNHLRVVRPRGLLFVTVPNRQRTFDFRRPPTPWDHVVRDHLEGPQWSCNDHFREWARLVEQWPADALEERIAFLKEWQVSIHFHVWNPREFRRFLLRCQRELSLPFTIEYFAARGIETVAILRKRRRAADRNGARLAWLRHEFLPLALAPI